MLSGDGGFACTDFEAGGGGFGGGGELNLSTHDFRKRANTLLLVNIDHSPIRHP